MEEEPDDVRRALWFDQVLRLTDRQVWMCLQKRGEALIEFLAPAFGDERVTPLPWPRVTAKELNCLIADPIQAVALDRSGILVQIPCPERYGAQKLIVADRRPSVPDQAK